MVGLSLGQFLKFKVHVVLELLIVLPDLHACLLYTSSGFRRNEIRRRFKHRKSGCKPACCARFPMICTRRSQISAAVSIN